MEKISVLHEILFSSFELMQIQCALAISIVHEDYQIFSLFIHLYEAYKKCKFCDYETWD